MSQQPTHVFHPQGQTTDGRGLGAGLTSLTASLLAPGAAAVTVPIGLLSALMMLSPYGGTSDRYWIVALIMGGIPGLLGMLAVVTGIVAIIRSRRMNAGRITGIVGLSIMALNIVGTAFMVARFLGYL
ncbi:hypothetical protein [Arthrobacter sp. NA-172]|uniref:hypothetical protein n=1 Tax=Arthrobacter sp. NA-172 TaxID=3367524 RepID=UPI0037548FDA